MASSSKFKKIYEVFLSFRGIDLRNNFVSHLYQVLNQNGIYTFRDSEELRKGEQISSALVKAIEESHIAIIIFSENYVSSTWCLEEVAKIMECKEQRDLIVFSVFYKVEPKEVRTPREKYREAMLKHESKFGKDSEEVKKWTKALFDAGSLSGWHLRDGDESELIQEIVTEISIHLDRIPLHVAKHPVGIHSQVVQLKSMLNLEFDDDVLMVGLWGQGGIGKTTLAKAVYNDIFNQFGNSCFLANVREVSKDCKDLVTLQEKLLFEILALKERLVVSNVDRGINLIKERLCHKKVLLILDDVDDLRQLHALVGEGKWLRNGSRVIVTTRDSHLLTYLGIDQDHVYKVRELDGSDARELFSKHAFPIHQKFKIRTDLVDSVLNHAKGLPLALEVLGSFLCGRREDEWESALDEISMAPTTGINDALKISYGGLEPKVKEIFLHIACFFKGWNCEYVKKVLNSCDLKAVIGLQILMERSLIRTESGSIQMHDLIQLMGMDIVNQESDDPGKRSRLWLYDDVVDILSSDMGDCAVKAIVLEPPEPIEICISSDAFTKMRRLRLLILHNVHDSFQGPICLPNELRWFEWPKCARQILEFSSSPNKLVGLDMSGGNITGAVKQFKGFQNLKYLNFSACESLVRLPDLSCTPNLEQLDLCNCKNLVEAHESIAYHNKLQVLDFRRCSELSVFPNELKSKNLQTLNLEECTKFERFPDIPHKLEALKKLHLKRTAIKGLPTSIENLVSLECMYLSNCKNLMSLPSSIYKLQNLEDLALDFCTNLIGFPKHEDSADPCMKTKLSNLHQLDLSGCNLSEVELLENLSCFPFLASLVLSGNNITSLPTSINKRHHLSCLRVENCHQLQEIPELPPFLNTLRMDNCESLQNCGDLTSFHDFVRRWLTTANICSSDQVPYGHFICLPGGELPEWVLPVEEDSISFMASEDLYDKILGFALCVVLGDDEQNNDEQKERLPFELVPRVNGKRRNHIVPSSELDSNQIWLQYLVPIELWGVVDFGQIDGSYVQLSLRVSGIKVKKWGFRIICKQLEDDLTVVLQDNQLIDPALLYEICNESMDSEAKSSLNYADSSIEAALQKDLQDSQMSVEKHSRIVSKKNELILPQGVRTKTMLNPNSFQGPLHLPNELRWLKWPGFAPSIPEFSFGPKKLVGFDMSKCNIPLVPKQFKEKSISDGLVTSSGGSCITRVKAHPPAAEDQKALKPLCGMDLNHASAGYITKKGLLLSDLTEKENVTVASEAKKLEAMQEQRAESDIVPMKNARDTEAEIFSWVVKKDADPQAALEKVRSYSSHSESEVGSDYSESESEDTNKKMKIKANPEYHTREALESAALQMQNTVEPEVEHFFLEVNKDAASEEFHSDLLEQESEVDSYWSGSEYEVGDKKAETEASPEYEIMHFSKMQKKSSPDATLDDNDASIDMLVSGEKQEGRPQGCGAINYDSILDHLVKCIGKSKNTKIGIYGKNEVGKAIVIEALKESAILRSLFDRVICVTIPLNCDMEKLQKEVAGQISSDLTEAKAVDVPHLLVNELEGLKFLLILVGINQHMKLETMRIPHSAPVGSKIVFVTGSAQLCNEMEVDKKICLDNLLFWELFRQNAGEVVDSTEVQVLAEEIVRMCRYNSHAVILMARALQNVDDIIIWKRALERLTVCPASHEAGTEALMANVLRFGIDQLEDDKARRCLKNLALCNNYQEIVSESAIGLWVRDGMVDTHDEGQKVLKSLVNANLLKVDENGQFFKFQDLDQHILVNLIFKPEESRMFLMRGGLDLTEPPEVEEWESAKEICLMHTGISELPEEPRCPSLSSLFLQRNYKLRKLPSSFFNQMPALEVLNLSRTRIRCLPESISQLVSLKRLFLNDCVLLRSISPAIGRLKQLEILDLEGTKIMNLPKEIECLINLTCLGISISGTEPSNDLKTVIPHGVISALSHLEELNLDVDPDAEWWDISAEGIVSEVCNLKRLSTIKFSFPRLELLRQLIQLRESMGLPSLAHFRLLVGNHANRTMNRLPLDIEFELEQCDRYLRYINGDGVFTEIKDILQQSDAFFLERHANVKKLSELGIDSMEQLKYCVLGECNELEVLVDASDTMHQEASTESHCKGICFESLEFLYVYCMRNLRNIWKGSVQKGCLSSLKLLTLCRCPELTVIFSLEMLANLNNLEEVTIEDCPAIKSLIISCQTSIGEVLKKSYFLPMLKKLSLHYVPKLSNISCGLRIAPRLERLSFYDCPSLKSLLTDEVSSEHLKKIRGERSWWKDLEWRGQKPDHLDSIFVPIDTCDVP